MQIKEIYRLYSPTREDLRIRGYSFGGDDPSACIIGAFRGSEIQQLYICSLLVKTLGELESNGCISAGKEILVIPSINPYTINTGNRYWGVGTMDINRCFPGDPHGDTPFRIADGVMRYVSRYPFGIQFAGFYMPGEFVPHVRLIDNGYQNLSLANLFGLPYAMVRKATPVDTRSLSYNWQNERTAAFSVYTNTSENIDEESALQAVAAVLRFLTRMGLIRYESHSGYICHAIHEEDLSDVHTTKAGIYRRLAEPGSYVHYRQPVARILDPFDASVKEEILAPTEGIMYYAHRGPLVCEGDLVCRLIHRLHN